MNRFLLEFYLKHKQDKHVSREQQGAFAGMVGIVCNLLLCAFKLAIGLLAGSIAIIADAVNNFFDTASSIMTLVGFKMSQKPADKEHPFGHARIEYLAGAFISVVIILVGVELLKSSVSKIVKPEQVSFSLLSLIVLFVAILTKSWMLSFYRFVGERIKSATLIVAAKDSRNDVIGTTVILIGVVIQFFFGFNLDGWFGAALAVFIIVSGFLSIKDSLNPLLGEGPPIEIVKELSNAIRRYDGVLGLHDLMIHTYGPNQLFATVHIEVAAQTDPLTGHGMIDHIERDVEAQLGIRLVCHYDPIDTPDEKTTALAQQLTKLVQQIDASLTIHDLRTVKTQGYINVIFDVGVPPDYKGNTEDLKGWIAVGVATLDRGYNPVIQIDRNYIVPQ